MEINVGMRGLIVIDDDGTKHLYSMADRIEVELYNLYTKGAITLTDLRQLCIWLRKCHIKVDTSKILDGEATLSLERQVLGEHHFKCDWCGSRYRVKVTTKKQQHPKDMWHTLSRSSFMTLCKECMEKYSLLLESQKPPKKKKKRKRKR